MRQPDIEIYLKDADHHAITGWLSEALGPCSPWQQKGQTYKCSAGSIPVTWLPKAVGKWHSLVLDSDATPWDDDLACAQGRLRRAECRSALRPRQLGRSRKPRTSRPLDAHQQRRRRGNHLAHQLGSVPVSLQAANETGTDPNSCSQLKRPVI